MEHEHALAEAIGTDFKAGPIGGEGILTAGPESLEMSRLVLLFVIPWLGVVEVVVLVVEHDFEHPIGLVELCLGQDARALSSVIQQRDAVAISDMLEIPIGSAPLVLIIIALDAVTLVDLGDIYTAPILRFVFVENGITFIVTSPTDEPTEDACRITRIGYTGVVVLAVEREDVVLRDGAPIHIAAIGNVRPALDTGKEPFDTGAVAVDCVGVGAYCARRNNLRLPLPLGVLDQQWHQIFHARENEFIRIITV
jgi:hypothetical protein